MKTISIETTNTITRIIIGPDGLQSRRLAKCPDEPELKRRYEEEQLITRAEIEEELRAEYGDTYSEETVQEYVAEEMQPMTPEEEDHYYGRSCTNFVDVSVYDATDIEIQKNVHRIRVMILGGPYGPLCILDDTVEDLRDQGRLRAGIAVILNTIAAAFPHDTSVAARMKTALDKLDADLTTTIRMGGAEFIFHPDHLTVNRSVTGDKETATYPRNKLYNHSTTFAPKADGSCDRKISLCVFPPANSIALKHIDIFQGTFDTLEDPPGFSHLIHTIVAYLPEHHLDEATASEETGTQESSESGRSSPI